MMYNSNFVLCVKQNEKILREDKDNILLPFGSEYTLLLKNLESKKALVKVSIDGEDVLDGQGLIIAPNCTTEITGFLQGRHAKNAFRFIEKTQEISDFRGDRIDDSLIRVEVQFEKVRPIYETAIWYDYHSDNTGAVGHTGSQDINFRGANYNCNDEVVKSLNSNVNCMAAMAMPEDGITVKGTKINQNFSYGSIGELEYESIVLVLKLKGYKENKRVQKVITVQDKKTCPTCGKNHKVNSNFCDRCGTNID